MQGLTNSEDIMGVTHKRHLHHRVSMGEEGSMAVPKIQAPDFDVLVGRPADQQMGVGRDVHGECGELVAVQAQEEFQAVCEEDLDGAVEKSSCQQLACTRINLLHAT